MPPFPDRSSTRILVPHPPDDTVSRLRFSPSNDPLLLAASWNGSIRCWKVSSPTLQSTAVSLISAPNNAPILDASFDLDPSVALFGGASKTVIRWDLNSGAQTVVAAHDGVVKCINVVEEVKMVATGGWEGALRYWDVRAPTGRPVGEVKLPGRVYAMDCQGPLMVVAMSERMMAVYDVRKPEKAFRESYSQLWYQSKSVAIWSDRMGYCVGGIDGRVSIDHVQEGKGGGSFVCHKENGKGFAVNAIRFHRQSGIFATASSDGRWSFWDKDKRDGVGRRVDKEKGPVCDFDFSHDGSIFAYAVGYDWSIGAAGITSMPEGPYVVVDRLEDGELDRYHNSGYGGRGRGRGRRRGGGNRR